MLDQVCRKCFRDIGEFELETVHSLVKNEASGRLPRVKRQRNWSWSLLFACEFRLGQNVINLFS